MNFKIETRKQEEDVYIIEIDKWFPEEVLKGIKKVVYDLDLYNDLVDNITTLKKVNRDKIYSSLWIKLYYFDEECFHNLDKLIEDIYDMNEECSDRDLVIMVYVDCDKEKLDPTKSQVCLGLMNLSKRSDIEIEFEYNDFIKKFRDRIEFALNEETIWI